MRILVTGSRDWDDHLAVQGAIIEVISETCRMGYDCCGYPVDWDTRDVVLVHGACPTGADEMADEYAVNSWIQVERHPAEWDKYGKRAGFIRNKAMVDLGADICLAFIKNRSRGATMTADLAEKAGIPTRRIIR